MKRRQFLGAAGGAALALGAFSTTKLSKASLALKNWVWISGGGARTPEEWRNRFARFSEAGIRGVLVSGGDVATLSAAAHSQGLEFHRWIWVLNRNGDRWAQESHREWFTVSRNGDSSLDKPPYVGYYKWVCPTRPPVREYLSKIVGEIANDRNVDGVHLDYIRHSDVILPIGLWSKYDLVQDSEHPEFDFCYCDVCRETFRELTGQDPIAMLDPAQNEAWREFRWNSVTELVTLLAEVVHDRDKPISAAVFPTPTIARRLVRQDWGRWPLDAFFPMAYNKFYNKGVDWIGTATREGVTALAGEAPLYSGLYVPDLSPGELYDAVRFARREGAAGVSLFGTGQLTDEHLTRFSEAIAE